MAENQMLDPFVLYLRHWTHRLATHWRGLVRAHKWRIEETNVRIVFDTNPYVVGKSQSVARL